MAIDPKTVELINADIDGEIGAADKEELTALLSSSPEAKAMPMNLDCMCRWSFAFQRNIVHSSGGNWAAVQKDLLNLLISDPRF